MSKRAMEALNQSELKGEEAMVRLHSILTDVPDGVSLACYSSGDNIEIRCVGEHDALDLGAPLFIVTPAGELIEDQVETTQKMRPIERLMELVENSS